MSKLGKFAKIFEAVEPLAKPFLPGGVGSVLDIVNGHLNNGGVSGALPDALNDLAADNDEQTAAILKLHERQEEFDVRLKALENK